MQNVIKDILSTSGISKTQFSKDLGISKSYVINVINGKKKCSRSMYEKIRRLSYLSEKQKDELEFAFYSEKYGKKDYELLLLTIEQLKSFNAKFEKQNNIFVRTDFMERLFENNSVAHVINGKAEFFEIVLFFTEKCLVDENPFFFSNYSFSMGELNDILFSLFRDRDYSKKIDFEHIVTFNNSDPQGIISSLFSAFNWSRILLTTRKINTSDDSVDRIFPYYIIMNNAVLLFEESLESGVIFTMPSIIEYYTKVFKEKQTDFIPICGIIYDETECLGQTDCYTDTEHLYFTIGGIACLGPFADYDILNNIAGNIPYRDQLIRLFIAHYNNLFNESGEEYINESAYWDFVENGDIRVITDKYVACCSYDDRIKILKSILERRNDSNSLTIKLLNENQLSIPNGLGFDCFENSIVITSLFMNEPCTELIKPYCVMANINYGEFFWFRSLIENLHNYIKENELVLSDEASIRAFERMIAKCEGLKNDSSDETT